MKLGIIVQCRMNSKRLPGKILKKVLGKSLLEYLIERLLRVRKVNDICIACTTNKEDGAILDLANKYNLSTYCGSENNVLERYYHAASKYKYTDIVRVTSDCPLIDPSILNEIIIKYYSTKNIDYISNSLKRTYPLGMEAEVFSFKSLQTSYKEVKNDFDKEHVTPYIKRNIFFKKKGIVLKKIMNKYRLTLDTKEDFFLISKVLINLYPKNNFFTLMDVINFLNKNKDIFELNKNVKQIS